MKYADFSYYSSGYLLGKSPVIPDAEFPYWEKQAGHIIDQHTFGRMAADSSLVDDNVRDCTCELAELLYQSDKMTQQTAEQGGAGLLSSFSNDGESGTFDLSQSDYTKEGKKEKIREILFRYFSGTGFLYQGV